MSIIPRSIFNDQGFGPLFRFIEDFDTYKTGQGRVGSRGHLQTFQPKFDVRETKDAYELHGELPGMDKKDVNIEFPEPQTMVIRGRIERAYTEGTSPAGAITGGGEELGRHSHQPTGEEEETEKAGGQVEPASKKLTDSAKYWVSERSIGEFTRCFNFPSHINQDGVSASLKDGILNVIVPKLKKSEARRIAVE